MKKIIFLLSFIGMASLFAGAAFPSKTSKNNTEIKNGCGYRIIEYGTGIDCHGDTVVLKKAKGFQHMTAVKKNDSHKAV